MIEQDLLKTQSSGTDLPKLSLETLHKLTFFTNTPLPHVYSELLIELMENRKPQIMIWLRIIL